jgi:hypothetical protein
MSMKFASRCSLALALVAGCVDPAVKSTRTLSWSAPAAGSAPSAAQPAGSAPNDPSLLSALTPPTHQGPSGQLPEGPSKGDGEPSSGKPTPCDALFAGAPRQPPGDPDDLLFHVNRVRAIPEDYPVPHDSSWTPCGSGAWRRGPTGEHDFGCIPASYSHRNREALRRVALESDAPAELTRTSDGLEVGLAGKVGFKPMLDAARAAGHEVRVRSGFRAYAVQQTTFRAWVRVEMARGTSYGDAVGRVSTSSARPGHSEHQLGTTADLVFRIPHGGFYEGWSAETFAASEAMQWVMANAHRFGIVLTYGKDKVDVTQYAWEPWHYRYVGVEAADTIRRCGLSTEEYLRGRYGLPARKPVDPDAAKRSKSARR